MPIDREDVFGPDVVARRLDLRRALYAVAHARRKRVQEYEPLDSVRRRGTTRLAVRRLTGDAVLTPVGRVPHRMRVLLTRARPARPQVLERPVERAAMQRLPYVQSRLRRHRGAPRGAVDPRVRRDGPWDPTLAVPAEDRGALDDVATETARTAVVFAHAPLRSTREDLPRSAPSGRHGDDRRR